MIERRMKLSRLRLSSKRSERELVANPKCVKMNGMRRTKTNVYKIVINRTCGVSRLTVAKSPPQQSKRKKMSVISCFAESQL